MDFSNIDAIIFDSDGVLVDSEVIHIAVERELLGELGFECDLQTYIARFVGLSNTDYHSQLSRDYETQGLGKLPEDLGDQLRRRIWRRIDAELQPIPGVNLLVERFGGPVAVASSAVLPRLVHKLKLTNLFDVFSPHIYSSDHVSKGKPEPDLFLHAAEKLGVPPSRCLVIEDSINGVMAGRSANMLTVGFTGGSHADAEHGERLLNAGANLVVDGHAELAFAMFG